MSRHARKTEIHRRQVRDKKLAMLRKRYAAAKNDAERTRVIEKVRRVSPSLTHEAFVETVPEPRAKA